MKRPELDQQQVQLLFDQQVELEETLVAHINNCPFCYFAVKSGQHRLCSVGAAWRDAYMKKNLFIAAVVDH